MKDAELQLARKVEAFHRAGIQPSYWRLATAIASTVPAVHALATAMRRQRWVQAGTKGVVRLTTEGREAVADARDALVHG